MTWFPSVPVLFLKACLAAYFVLVASLLIPLQAQDFAHQNELFWHPNRDQSITWDLTKETRLPHQDNIELSGTQVSTIIRYEVDQAKHLHLTRDVIFP
jgi:hypothetical protein